MVSDGSSVLRYLRKKGEYKEAIRPDIILMNLKMPRMDGHEALSEIKEDSDLKNIPVVILTASKAREDVEKGYNLNANCYITKPLKAKDFREMLENVLNFWMSAVSLPAEIKPGDKPEKK
ncbi:MAG: response regulator [Elusimicrobiota bacterium]|nr:response regulator [Elusimicrobiota bacterium]